MLKVKSIKPLFTGVLTTANKYETTSTKNGIIISAKQTEGHIKEYQTVVKVGSSVREIKPGDIVLINPSRYLRKKFDENSIRDDFDKNPTIEINIPTVVINDKEYFLIEDRDVAYIIDDCEEIPDTKPSIIMPKNTTIN
ncbi:MAG: hypothetical protein MR840_02780 [Solobacterium sp.]|nr:hypothetical protein [Clostridium sp.]MCI6877713.1 hypothetical protein [Solobacterium sp.]MCI7207918.1 hypothetical protein [Clostridium sp.]